MLGRIVLFFILIPLIELVLLSQLLQKTGVLATVALVLVTGVVGASLARQQGMQVWKSIHQQMAQGQSPSREILNGVMILLAGAFLITPGILTDLCGFLLLVPRIRMKLGGFLARWFMAKTASKFQSPTWVTDGLGGEEASDEQPSVRVVDPRETS